MLTDDVKKIWPYYSDNRKPHMLSQSLINKLDELFASEKELTGYENLPVTFYKNSQATVSELSLFGQNSKLLLPDDYLNFLTNYNGCILFRFDDLGGYEFLGTAGLERQNEIQKETYEDDWNSNLTVFCNLIGDGDFISFKNHSDGTYEILDCYHDEAPKNWAVISNSLGSFLESLIDLKGQPYWL